MVKDIQFSQSFHHLVHSTPFNTSDEPIRGRPQYLWRPLPFRSTLVVIRLRLRAECGQRYPNYWLILHKYLKSCDFSHSSKFLTSELISIAFTINLVFEINNSFIVLLLNTGIVLKADLAFTRVSETVVVGHQIINFEASIKFKFNGQLLESITCHNLEANAGLRGSYLVGFDMVLINIYFAYLNIIFKKVFQPFVKLTRIFQFFANWNSRLIPSVCSGLSSNDQYNNVKMHVWTIYK